MTEKNSYDVLNDLLQEFIELANQQKDRGIDPEIISAALMGASSTYTTFVAAGNEGYLTDTGVDKVVDRYREFVVSIQAGKKAQAETNGKQGE